MLSVADEETNCVVYYNTKYYMRNNKYEIILSFFLKKNKNSNLNSPTAIWIQLPVEQIFYIYIFIPFSYTHSKWVKFVFISHTTQQQYNTRLWQQQT